VTSSVSGKRATAAPAARGIPLLSCLVTFRRALRGSPSRTSLLGERWRRDLNPCTRICSPLPRLSATPPARAGLVVKPVRPSPSGRRDSNPRPSPWQGDALPTEPRPHHKSRSGVKCECNLNPAADKPQNRAATRQISPQNRRSPGRSVSLRRFATRTVHCALLAANLDSRLKEERGRRSTGGRSDRPDDVGG
jgi:hypothetical protein